MLIMVNSYWQWDYYAPKIIPDNRLLYFSNESWKLFLYRCKTDLGKWNNLPKDTAIGYESQNFNPEV